MGVYMDDPRGVIESEATLKPTGTLASSVYQQLRSDILKGRFEPGSKLRLQHLGQQYHVGNSPLREALNRLSANGLVTREENKGFRVSTASIAELEELIRTRCMLEQTALRESVESGDAAWEERVVISFHRLSRLEEGVDKDVQHRTPEWEAAHRDYHLALLSACGSNILLEFCRQLHEQTLRYRSLVEVVKYRDIHECSEHRDLQEAVLDRDVERAVSMLHAHYSVTLEIIKSSGALT
jgi:GntR family carbon starvation induced transcriptional regulator